MWRVPQKRLSVSLPSGFFLKEDCEFVFLFYKHEGEEEEVAVFSRVGVDLRKVEEAAQKYLDRKSD